MAKFEIGDKVWVLSGGSVWRCPGEEGVVSGVAVYSPYPEYTVTFEEPDKDGDLDLIFGEFEIELATEGEPETEEDVVNHPRHYTAYGVEIIKITENMSFCRGNAVKYIARAGLKNPDKELEDLEKGLWYLNREVARMKEASK